MCMPFRMMILLIVLHLALTFSNRPLPVCMLCFSCIKGYNSQLWVLILLELSGSKLLSTLRHAH